MKTSHLSILKINQDRIVTIFKFDIILGHLEIFFKMGNEFA